MLELTRDLLDKLEADIKRRHSGVQKLGLSLIRGEIELATLTVKPRKRGTGTAVMNELCAFADRHGVTMKLTPAQKGFEATTSRARLIRFYKRFGFQENHKQTPIAAGMIRSPVQRGGS